MRKVTLITLLFFTILSIRNNTRAALAQTSQSDFDYERVIVKFRPLIPKFIKNTYVNSYGLKLDEQLKLRDTFVVKVPKVSTEILVGKFSKNILVEYAEADAQAEAFYYPNDPMLSDQWGLDIIDAPGAWDVNPGSNAVDIAIIDTGINSSHTELSDKITKSVNCTVTGCPNYQTNDPYGHGTHIAGIAAATFNNGIGISGVSPDSRLMSVKVLDDRGSGYYSWIANGIVWAADNGAEVINLSLGGRYSSYTLQSAVNYAWNKGVVIIAAAGNNGNSTPVYPAYYGNVISVAATDDSDHLADFSTYGYWVDVAAPGVDILSTFNSSYVYKSGTSMASPFVAGIAALIKSEYPGWSNSQIRSKLESSSDVISGSGYYWQHGRVNACGALNCLDANPTPTTTPVATDTPTPTSTPVPTNTPTPTAEPSITPTLTPTSTPTPIPSPTNTPAITPTLTLTPTPFPTPTQDPSFPWWCEYIPWHYMCQ
jgi:thermitase